uniref:Uncharacterized protein n=1 Tax=Strongyloides venezuelensis TaxID=75913 RepID=A0A0K0FTI9_STRVS
MKLTITKLVIFIVFMLFNLASFEDPYKKIKDNLKDRNTDEVKEMGESCMKSYNDRKKTNDLTFEYTFENISIAYKLDKKDNSETVLLIFFGKNTTENNVNYEQFGGIYNGNAKNKKCYSVSLYYSK